MEGTVRRPWAEDSGWFVRYAKTAARLKGLGGEEATAVETAVAMAHQTVYRAVAFDVDGTLTKPDQADIEPRMAALVGRLLRRGVPVLLVSGRGRKSLREAVDSIRVQADISNIYLRRLFGISHNGVFLLEPPSDLDQPPLSVETHLSPNVPEIQELADAVEKRLRDAKVAEEFEVSVEPHSLRVIFEEETARTKAEEAIQPLIDEQTEKFEVPLYLSRGAYATTASLDVSPTNKDAAVEAFAQRIGVPDDGILRIGDQGRRGGNDFTLLDRGSAFSVGEWSDEPARCHPVLDKELSRPLQGADATEQLLERVLLFPALSLTPESAELALPGLRTVERAAVERARAEWPLLLEEVQRAAALTVPGTKGILIRPALELADIYDPLSGAVRFKEWEFSTGLLDDPAVELFGLRDLLESSGEPQMQWSMYSDSGILLRGPRYYFGLVEPKGASRIERFFNTAEEFLGQARNALQSTSAAPPSSILFKTTLAIFDNVRSMLMQIAFILLTYEKATRDFTYPMTSSWIVDHMTEHWDMHLRFLLDGADDWGTLHKRYAERLDATIGRLDSLKRVTADLDETHAGDDLFRFRECDNFLENFLAVRIAMRQFLKQRGVADRDDVVGIGLAYGGIELPLLASILSARESLPPIRIGLAQVSLYSDFAAGQRAREAPPGYVEGLREIIPPICVVGGTQEDLEGKPAFIMDDNTTTCGTLQLARDMVVSVGGDVRGMVVVRYPSVNRRVQMGFQDHGCPDPEALLGFVRGLVAPSPYSRLLIPGEEPNGVYKDQSHVFNKSKERIRRYLLKNGTPSRD